jgi:transposase
MLGNRTPPRLTEFDQQAFDIFVPDDHYLRKAMAAIDWDSFHEVLAPYYSADQGRPSDPPVMLLKLEFLRYQYNLSDRQVIARAKTDLSFRYFLQVGHYHCLVDPSLLCLFRGRLGRDGFRKVFNQLVGMAREHGLVKDRLRIKDASHVIANIAIPATLGLVSQARDKLLAAAAAFEPVRVEGERVNRELLRQRTEGSNNEQRLLARVTHLREILSWVDELLPPEGDANRDWKRLVAQRQVAHKILADQENPQAGDRTLSTVDPEARRGKHGDWFDGYMVDILMDADIDLITQINVLPAGGNEAQDAIEQPSWVYQSTDFHRPFFGASNRQRGRVGQRPRQREYFVRGGCTEQVRDGPLSNGLVSGLARETDTQSPLARRSSPRISRNVFEYVLFLCCIDSEVAGGPA